MTEAAQIAQRVYWQTLNDMLHPATKNRLPMPGFDEEFIDLPDYILRITHRIWEQKNIALCTRHYAEICPVHTLSGYVERVEDVVQGTFNTIAAFPDRSLIGEDVIWSDDGDDGLYSSHRITSIMSNTGAPSEFASHTTFQTGRVTTIADCVCKDNKIVYEWLMRDNSFLVKQLGISVVDAARHMAAQPANDTFVQWYQTERERTLRLDAMSCNNNPPPALLSLVEELVNEVFIKKNLHRLNTLYHPGATVLWPGGREAVGIPAIGGLLTQWLSQFRNLSAVIDHVAVVALSEHRFNVAVRWGLAGDFQGTLAGENIQKPSYILASSHFVINHQRIEQERTVFDEVAQLVNLLRL